MHSIFVFDDVEAAGGVFPDGWVVPADVVGWDADGVGDGFELLAEDVFDEGFDVGAAVWPAAVVAVGEVVVPVWVEGLVWWLSGELAPGGDGACWVVVWWGFGHVVWLVIAGLGVFWLVVHRVFSPFWLVVQHVPYLLQSDGAVHAGR